LQRSQVMGVLTDTQRASFDFHKEGKSIVSAIIVMLLFIYIISTTNVLHAQCMPLESHLRLTTVKPSPQ